MIKISRETKILKSTPVKTLPLKPDVLEKFSARALAGFHSSCPAPSETSSNFLFVTESAGCGVCEILTLSPILQFGR
jgi:hypothetical protein